MAGVSSERQEKGVIDAINRSFKTNGFSLNNQISMEKNKHIFKVSSLNFNTKSFTEDSLVLSQQPILIYFDVPFQEKEDFKILNNNKNYYFDSDKT